MQHLKCFSLVYSRDLRNSQFENIGKTQIWERVRTQLHWSNCFSSGFGTCHWYHHNSYILLPNAWATPAEKVGMYTSASSWQIKSTLLLGGEEEARNMSASLCSWLSKPTIRSLTVSLVYYVERDSKCNWKVNNSPDILSLWWITARSASNASWHKILSQVWLRWCTATCHKHSVCVGWLLVLLLPPFPMIYL